MNDFKPPPPFSSSIDYILNFLSLKVSLVTGQKMMVLVVRIESQEADHAAGVRIVKMGEKGAASGNVVLKDQTAVGNVSEMEKLGRTWTPFHQIQKDKLKDLDRIVLVLQREVESSNQRSQWTVQ